MRRSLTLAVALTLNGSLLIGAGFAQQRGDSADSGATRTFSTRDIRAFDAERQVRPSAPPAYSRPAPSAARPVTETRARAATYSQGVRTYFPAARAGRGPNRNVVDPRSLCVPGRMALLQR